MSDKFRLVKAGSLPSNTVVIARSDGDSMHGKNYLVVNGDKPHAWDVYMVLRTYGYRIPMYEKRLQEKLLKSNQPEAEPVDEDIVLQYMSLLPNVRGMYNEIMENDPELKKFIDKFKDFSTSQIIDDCIRAQEEYKHAIFHLLEKNGFLVNNSVIDFFTLLPFYKEDLERIFAEEQGSICVVDTVHYVLCRYLNNILVKKEVKE